MAEDSIRIEYNEGLKLLAELLVGVERAGDFFVSGKLEVPMPKIEVTGAGVLSFPVPETQIQQLIAHATRAPYGRGEETIQDESVRKVWQLPPDAVRIGGKSWAVSFDNILKQVVAGLGCEGMAVSAEFYKLLVYDTGGFFLAHRDTEKAGGMFGTLVVVLPSAHRGGELVIRHAGREVAVDMSSAEISELSFAAFYADCQHEVRPITDGNRVCLVYNLIQQAGAKNKNGTLHAPDYEKQIAAAAKLLETKLSAPDAPAKIAWLLEHHYSPDGLSFAGLKSADAARAKVLAQVAERAGCAAHLGIVHIEESGSARENYHEYRPRGRGWYRDDEDEVEDASSDDFEVIDVCDWRHYVSQWRDRRDQPVEFGEIPLAPGELLPVGALDDEKPDEQRLMEASGNEGASFERSYHRAALVIWRRERYAEVLLQAGVAAALPYLKEKIEACAGVLRSCDAPSEAVGATPPSREKQAASRLPARAGDEASPSPSATRASQPPARQEAVALARQLVNAWKEAPEHAGYHQPAPPEKRDGMLKLLNELGDAALVEEFIAKVVTRDYDGSDNAALAASARLLGAEKSAALLSELMRRHTRHWHGHCVALLGALAQARLERGCVEDQPQHKEQSNTPRRKQMLRLVEDDTAALHFSDWQAALRRIAEAIVSKLDEVGKKQRENEWMDWRLTERARPVNAALVTGLLEVLGTLDASALRIAAAEKFAARPDVFDPVTILVPALGSLTAWDAAATRLWEHSAEFLLRRSGRPPEAPQDWRQDAKLSCACADCRELQRFVLDPAEQTHRFRVKKERRQHLHQQIEQHSLDMTHITDRKGSPQTLVCTKDRRSYKRRCEQYCKDIAALVQLAELAEKSFAGNPAVLKRIAAARALAKEWSPV